MNIRDFYIEGRWTAPNSPRRMEMINPATEEVYETIPLADLNDVDRAVTAAKKL